MTAQNGLCLALSETPIASILSASQANQHLSRCLTWPMEKAKNKGADALCRKVCVSFGQKPRIQLLKAYRIKFQKFAAHAHKDALINETFIPT